MSDGRLDVTLATKYANASTGKDGTRYAKVGAAFPMKNGSGGYSLRFDHAVVVVPGVTELVLFVPKESGGGGGL